QLIHNPLQHAVGSQPVNVIVISPYSDTVVGQQLPFVLIDRIIAQPLRLIQVVIVRRLMHDDQVGVEGNRPANHIDCRKHGRDDTRHPDFAVARLQCVHGLRQRRTGDRFGEKIHDVAHRPAFLRCIREQAGARKRNSSAYSLADAREEFSSVEFRCREHVSLFWLECMKPAHARIASTYTWVVTPMDSTQRVPARPSLSRRVWYKTAGLRPRSAYLPEYPARGRSFDGS